jgi:hypothetical protein
MVQPIFLDFIYRPSSSGRAKLRNVVLLGEEHRETVDANTDATSWRHAITEGIQEGYNPFR